MDIQHLVDRLEDLIDEGHHVPFSKYTLMDEERALEIIDQMRISVPEEIEKSSRVLAQRDRLLAQASEEAARVLQEARDKSDRQLEETDIVQNARRHAANIIEEARQEAAAMKAEADQYVLQVLSQLEDRLNNALRQVRGGVEMKRQDITATAQQQYNPQPPQQAASPFAPPAPQPQRESVEVGARANNAK